MGNRKITHSLEVGVKMRRYHYAIVIVIALLAALVPVATAYRTPDTYSGVTAEEEYDVLFQVSTIDALMLGVYDGTLSFEELEKRGGFGIGTFDHLDGEMIGLDGEYYQVKDDGVAYPVAGNMTTPFAAVTFFDADETISIEDAENYTQFGEYLDERLPSKNVFYAIRIDGTFPYMKTRSVPRQEKPYPLLAEVAVDQTISEFQNVNGTIVGFRSPEFVKGINIPGYHLHFITEDRKAGGHVLDFQIKDMEVEIDVTPDFFIQLPKEGDFYNIDLSQDLGSDLVKIEK